MVMQKGFLQYIKSFFSQRSDEIVLSDEVKFTLGTFSSGALGTLADGKPVFIYKDEPDVVEGYDGCGEIAVQFEAIPKAEFPNIRVDLYLRDDGGSSYRFEYFVSAHSAEDIDLLRAVRDKKLFYLLLIDLNGRTSLKKIEIGADEQRAIDNALAEMAEFIDDE